MTAAEAPVETTSTQISDTFSRRQVLDLPLASVNVNNLALLTPNTVDINTTGLNRAQVLQHQRCAMCGKTPIEDGIKLGRKVAKHIERRFFRPTGSRGHRHRHIHGSGAADAEQCD